MYPICDKEKRLAVEAVDLMLESGW